MDDLAENWNQLKTWVILIEETLSKSFFLLLDYSNGWLFSFSIVEQLLNVQGCVKSLSE